MSLTMGMTGCSLFSKSSEKTDGNGKGLKGWFQSGQDKTEVTENSDDKEADKVKEMANAVAISGDWAIETVMGKKAVGETVPFIKFAPGEKRIYGNNGCNVINAQYEINPAKGSISFSNIVSTMMLCADTNITDAEVGEALDKTKTYSMVVGEPDKTLTFFDAGGKTVMTLMHRDFHFLDGTWAVVAIDGEEVSIEDMKIALDVDEKRIHGNTGCNIINGELETDMDTPNSISFSKIGMTRMACPDSGWETRMMVALEEAITAKRISKDEIEFIGSNGQQVMLLRRTTPH